MQGHPPIAALNAYLDGFHFYNGHPQAQMEAHHYCSILNEEVIQCVIYDGNLKDAKLMGVEYIISARLFAGLPAEEKQLWHSHVHEVKSGQLIAPGIPEPAEHALMQKLVGTYGKTWHTWHTDQQKTLPLGVPQLMMGFTADGQIEPGRVAERDKRFGVDSEAKNVIARTLLPRPSTLVPMPGSAARCSRFLTPPAVIATGQHPEHALPDDSRRALFCGPGTAVALQQSGVARRAAPALGR